MCKKYLAENEALKKRLVYLEGIVSRVFIEVAHGIDGAKNCTCRPAWHGTGTLEHPDPECVTYRAKPVMEPTNYGHREATR